MKKELFMKALIKQFNSVGLWMEDIQIPNIKEDEVLIKTIKTSICGTDIHIYKWDEWAQKTIQIPLVIGHEFMGEIADVGKNVKDLRPGDRVTGEGHITCGSCPLCRTGKKHLCLHSLGLGVHCGGCFAEYFKLPSKNVFALPENISDDVAAIFDPLGNATHTALFFNLTGEDILITGAGPIGIMAAAVAKKAGARTVVIADKNPYRLNLAKNMGATHSVNIEKQSFKEVMSEAGINYGFTVGLEMSGSPQALNSIIETTQNGAHIALLGFLPKGTSIDWDLVIFKMLTIQGIYGREIFSTWYKMLHLLESGLDLNPLITHRFFVDDFHEAFDIMLSGNCGKVILNW